MTHFLDDDFKPDYLELVAGLRSQEYYVNMMIAWFLLQPLPSSGRPAFHILRPGA